jgi:hypothetical protein
MTYRYIRFGAAILNFLLPVSRWSLPDIAIEFHDPENVRVAVGISFLGALDPEIRIRFEIIFGHRFTTFFIV